MSNRGLLRGIPTAPDDFAIVFVIDGGAATITTGNKGGDLPVPRDVDVVEWEVAGDQAGAIVVDIWRSRKGEPLATAAASSICLGDKPTILASGTLASREVAWSLARGDKVRYNVDSVTSIRRVTVVLTCRPR